LRGTKVTSPTPGSDADIVFEGLLGQDFAPVSTFGGFLPGTNLGAAFTRPLSRLERTDAEGSFGEEVPSGETSCWTGCAFAIESSLALLVD